MKLNAINHNFKGKNKAILKGLEFVSDNNALIASGASLLLGGILRPIVTLSSPNKNQKDKELIASKSLASSLIGFGITNLIFTPISKTLKKIGDEPFKYLNEKTIKKLKGKSTTLKEAPAFNFLEQSIKMSADILSVLPKAFLTCALIYPLMKNLFNKKENKTQTFKGFPCKVITNIIENEKIQNFALKNQEKNISQHIMNAKDIFATGIFIAGVQANSKIKKEDKKTIQTNSIISTATTVVLGLLAKGGIDKITKKTLDNFKMHHAKDPKINKYLNGIKTLESVAILGFIYYALTPFISTYLTGKVKNEKN